MSKIVIKDSEADMILRLTEDIHKALVRGDNAEAGYNLGRLYEGFGSIVFRKAVIGCEEGTFEWAMSEMRGGVKPCRIRRRAWQEGESLTFMNGWLSHLCRVSKCTVRLTGLIEEDVTADDWEVTG